MGKGTSLTASPIVSNATRAVIPAKVLPTRTACPANHNIIWIITNNAKLAQKDARAASLFQEDALAAHSISSTTVFVMIPAPAGPSKAPAVLSRSAKNAQRPFL